MKPYYYFVDMFFIAVMLGYINHKFIKMQTTIAIMTGALIFSAFIIIFGNIPALHDIKTIFIDFSRQIDFYKVLMKGMLPYLLFAGSINIDLGDLRSEKKVVGLLAITSTILSALLIAICTFYLLEMFEQAIPFGYCLLFGALISPTDPIAVLGVLKDAGSNSDLSIKLAGESLFNDGVGIVLFSTFYTLVFGNQELTLNAVIHLFTIKAIGGITWGIVLGMLMYNLIKSIDDRKLEVLITIAVVTSGYSVAEQLNISGPLAMVVSGIFIGNKSDLFDDGANSQSYLKTFWELIDEILNAVLFLLMGFEILIIDYNTSIFVIMLAIIAVLLVRYLTVLLPILCLNRFKFPSDNEVAILTWGGLRGGLAIALALALPHGQFKDVILALTYSVVVFSVIVQGSTLKYLLNSK